MFGFSLPKILLLIVIIAVVWYGFKAVSRIQKSKAAKQDELEGEDHPNVGDGR